ncbi:MAG: DUF5687 family protein [Bacteroidales bacterium]|nr:DUF5687 family protein [Bacteroidales bacterium]
MGIAGTLGLFLKLGIPIAGASSALGQALVNGRPLVFGVIVVMVTAVIWLTRRTLHRNFQIDRGGSKRENRPKGSSLYGIFRGFGDTGRYMSLELAMLLRNKRPRNTMLLVPFFLVYFCFMFYREDGLSSPLFMLVVTIMLIGLGSVSYGQLIFSWESYVF